MAMSGLRAPPRTASPRIQQTAATAAAQAPSTSSAGASPLAFGTAPPFGTAAPAPRLMRRHTVALFGFNNERERSAVGDTGIGAPPPFPHWPASADSSSPSTGSPNTANTSIGSSGSPSTSYRGWEDDSEVDTDEDDPAASPMLGLRRLSLEMPPQELERLLALHTLALAPALPTIPQAETEGGDQPQPAQQQRPRRPVLTQPLPQPRMATLLSEHPATASSRHPAVFSVTHHRRRSLPLMRRRPRPSSPPRRRPSLEDHYPETRTEAPAVSLPALSLGAADDDGDANDGDGDAVFSEPSTPVDDAVFGPSASSSAATDEEAPLQKPAHPPKRRRSSGGGRQPEFLCAVRRLLLAGHPCLRYYSPDEPDFYVADPLALAAEWHLCAGSSGSKKKHEDGNGVHSLMCYYARVNKLITTKKKFGQRLKNVYRFPEDDC